MSTNIPPRLFSGSHLARLVLFALLLGLALVLLGAPLHTTPAAADASLASTPGPAGPRPLDRTSPPLQPAAAPSASFSLAGTLTLQGSENYLYSAVADVAGGFVYFGTYTSPGRIVKVRLSDFTKVATLTLDPNEGGLRAAVLDTQQGYAYFGSGTQPGKVIKVRLSDFTRVGALSLNVTEDELRAAVIDSTKGYAYFVTGKEPAVVFQLRLSDFTRVGALTLNAEDGAVTAMVLDALNGYIYLGANNRIVKVRLSDMTRLGALALNSGESVESGVIDPTGGYAYWGAHGQIVRVRLSDFTRVDALQAYADLLSSAAIDLTGGYAYFGSSHTVGGLHPPIPGKVVQVRLSDFSLTGTLTLNNEEADLRSAALDLEHGLAYLGTATVPGRIVKVRLSDLTRVDAVTLVAGDIGAHSAAVDAKHGYAYFGTGYRTSYPPVGDIGPARVVKVRLSDFSRVGSLALQTGNPNYRPENSYVQSALIDPDGGYAYFATNRVDEAISSDSSSVTKVRLSDFTQVATITLDAGQIEAAAIDPEHGFAYFGATSCGMTQICVSSVVKVRLSDLTKVGSGGLGFDLYRAHFNSAVIDPLHGYAYFGAISEINNPGRIAKFRLTDLALVDMMDLGPLDHPTGGAAVIDPAGGYAYFATASDGCCGLSKIRLSDFTRVSRFLDVAWGAGAAAIDPAAGYAYFGGSKLRLSDFNIIGKVPGWGPGGWPSSAAIDADKGYLYWGMWGDPGTVVRVDLGNTKVNLTSSANPSVPGQPVTFTAQVSPVVPNSGTPDGTVQFKVDGANLGTAIALSNGSATSLAASNLSAGTHTITALYVSPDVDWNNSQSTLTQTVNAGPAASTTKITSVTPPDSFEGDSATVSFSVTATFPGTGTPTGTVTVSDGTSQCSAAVATGSCTLTLFNPESKTLTATYPGDDHFAGSSGTMSHLVKNYAPSLAGLYPSVSFAGTNGLDLIVGGEHLFAGSIVHWNGSARSTTFLPQTQQLTAQILASDLAQPGTIQITVKHPGSNGDTSSPLTFTILSPTQMHPLYLPLVTK